MNPDRVITDDRAVLAELAQIGALNQIDILKLSGRNASAFGSKTDTWLLTHDSGQPDPADNGYTLLHWSINLEDAVPIVSEWVGRLGFSVSSNASKLPDPDSN